MPFAAPLTRHVQRRRRQTNVFYKVKGRNVIQCQGAQLSSATFDIEGANNRIEIGDGCILENVIFYVRGHDHLMFIDTDCVFRSGSDIWMEDSDCSLIIGRNSTFEQVHLALTEPKSKISIGRDCMFERGIDVRTGDSHSIISERTGERVNFAKDVSIGNHVWVCAHCTLLKGVSIADNCVVATGSIVVRSFEKPGVIIGGNPATQLKEGINWKRERIY